MNRYSDGYYNDHYYEPDDDEEFDEEFDELDLDYEENGENDEDN